MKRSRLMLGLVLLAAVGFAGCSDDDDDAPLSESKVTQVTQSSVVPMIQTLRALIPLLPSTKVDFATEKGSTCQSSDICTTGTFLVCTDGTWTFSECNAFGLLFDGAMTLLYDGTSGAATFSNLTVSSTTYNGTLMLARQGDCYTLGFTGFQTSASSTTASHVGTLELCTSDEWPSGGLQGSVTDSAGNYVFDYVFNASGSAAVVATLVQTNESLTCTVNLLTGTASCL